MQGRNGNQNLHRDKRTVGVDGAGDGLLQKMKGEGMWRREEQIFLWRNRTDRPVLFHHSAEERSVFLGHGRRGRAFGKAAWRKTLQR